MGDIVDIKPKEDRFHYHTEGEKIIGVSFEDEWSSIDIDDWGDDVSVNSCAVVTRENLRDLMIMWLALHYPDILAYEDD